MRKLFRAVSGIIPTPIILKGIGVKTISPFYHIVSNTPPLHVKNLYQVLSEKEFETDLDYFLKYFIPIDALTLIKRNNQKLIINKPTIYLSFDDGFREVKDIIAPILLRKGIPATFFINPAFIDNVDLMYRCKISLIVNFLESVTISNAICANIAFLLNTENDISKINKRILLLNQNQTDIIAKIANLIGLRFDEYLLKNRPYLSLEDLKALEKAGFAIGGHGYNHLYFHEISFEDQFSEVVNCMNWVGQNFPNQPRLFAFPFTDDGVSDNLIKRIVFEHENLCEISFGTSGIQPTRFQRHFQRIPMENNGIQGKSIVNSEILYYLAKKSLGFYRKII